MRLTNPAEVFQKLFNNPQRVNQVTKPTPYLATKREEVSSSTAKLFQKEQVSAARVEDQRFSRGESSVALPKNDVQPVKDVQVERERGELSPIDALKRKVRNAFEKSVPFTLASPTLNEIRAGIATAYGEIKASTLPLADKKAAFLVLNEDIADIQNNPKNNNRKNYSFNFSYHIDKLLNELPPEQTKSLKSEIQKRTTQNMIKVIEGNKPQSSSVTADQPNSNS